MDNALEEQNQEIQWINRDLFVKDEFTEPHHPQQNPDEFRVVKYIKEYSLTLIHQTREPPGVWFYAAK